MGYLVVGVCLAMCGLRATKPCAASRVKRLVRLHQGIIAYNVPRISHLVPHFSISREGMFVSRSRNFHINQAEGECFMSNLIVVAYDDPFQAEEVRTRLRKLQQDYLIDLEDAVVAVKDDKGKVKLHQMFNLTASGALSGGFWGTLIGLIFMNPLLGLAVGVGAGAVSGALSDVGINDDFMKNLAATFRNGSSVLFVLVRKATPDKVLAELQGTGGKVIKTSLTHEEEEKLQAVLSTAKAPAAD